MVGKKGFIRTLEAVIAILLVLGFILYILPRKQVLVESTIPEGLESSRNYILMEFLTNKEIRRCIGSVGTLEKKPSGSCTDSDIFGLQDCASKIEELLGKHTIPGFKYHCEICTEIAPCTDLYKIDSNIIKRSVYPGAVFIYLSSGNAKYVRVYFWRE